MSVSNSILVLVAINLEPHEVVSEHQDACENSVLTREIADEPSWQRGPRYVIIECVCDENDIKGYYTSWDGMFAEIGE